MYYHIKWILSLKTIFLRNYIYICKLWEHVRQKIQYFIIKHASVCIDGGQCLAPAVLLLWGRGSDFVCCIYIPSRLAHTLQGSLAVSPCLPLGVLQLKTLITASDLTWLLGTQAQILILHGEWFTHWTIPPGQDKLFQYIKIKFSYKTNQISKLSKSRRQLSQGNQRQQALHLVKHHTLALCNPHVRSHLVVHSS